TGLSASEFILAVPTSSPSVVYAWLPGDATFLRSADGGASWVSRPGPTGRFSLTSLSPDPNDPAIVYASANDGLFRTTDGGESWSRLTSPVVGRGPMLGIAVDPGDSTRVFAATFSGVYRSTDRGATWKPTALQRPVLGLLFDPAGYRAPRSSDGGTLFALTQSGLARTTDAGDSWKDLASWLAQIRRLAIDPTDSRILYVLSGAGLDASVYRSSNGGESLTKVPGAFQTGARAIVLAGSSAVLVGSERGVSRSEDGGNEWLSANEGIRQAVVGSLAIDPSDASVVFAAAGGNLLESRNAGQSWNESSPGSPDTRGFAIDPSDPATLYAGGSEGVRKSADGGRTWKTTGLADPIFHLLIDPGDSRRIFAARYAVHRSSDGADRWTRVLDPKEYASYEYFPPTFTAIAAAPSDGATVYAGGLTETGAGFLYRSDDGGDHWSDLKIGFPVNSLAVDSADPGIVHAGASGAVFRSLDGGRSWTAVPIAQDEPKPVSVWALARDPRHPSSVFAGTSAGLYWTNDRGASWSRFEPALDVPVRSLALDPTGRFLDAGTERGVFRLERSFAPCIDAPDRLCLLGAKYRATLTARDRRSGSVVTGYAVREGDRFGYFSFPDVTGDPGLPEVLVKMLDAADAPPPYGGGVWVFHSSLTDFDYRLTVLETQTGRVRIYDATYSGSLTCGEADTSAFDRAPIGEETSKRAPGAILTAASGAELFLLSGRFRATVLARDPRTGRVEEGTALARANGFGYFSLPGFTADPSFPEIVVKMIDARAQPGGEFWLFHSALTDLEYALTITDLLTGAVRTYAGTAAGERSLCGEADTAAFRD
ncbi:MAG TPA: hypothetical protein VKG01_06900, partial [Thermoanaerobaculia bacterium]|nr:hypothetical protein [Thermoanaerobaculia bacterium]